MNVRLLAAILLLSLSGLAHANSLQRAEVQARLEAHGVDSVQAQARVSALTDEEVALLAARYDELPAGGDGRLLMAAIVVVGVGYVIVKLLPLIIVGSAVAIAVKANRNRQASAA